MDYREWGSHARCVYSTQYTLRMGTLRMKQEEQADTRVITEKSGRKGRGHEGEKSQTRQN